MTHTVETIPTQLPVFPTLCSYTTMSKDEQGDFFRKLSEQVGLWSLYNFDRQGSYRPAFGINEELSELDEGLSELNSRKVVDAVGDIIIYMADYYSKRGWDMGEAWNRRANPVWFYDKTSLSGIAIRLVGALSHAHLKSEQNIRGGSEKNDLKMQSACQNVLWFLEQVCEYIGRDVLGVVANVWVTVSKRDWKKAKDNAHVLDESGSTT